jgi:GR25 family glycosyltransferase involved in LPS biosynthesis
MRILIILCVFILVYFSLNCLVYNLDNFENSETKLHLYVITLKHENRLQNIETQQSKIDEEIQLFDAVKGDFMNVDEILNVYTFSSNFFSNEYVNDKKRKREVGYYLSHFNLYEKIKNEHINGYTIIFEDDFNIYNNFINDINNIILNLEEKYIDFDIIFLGQNTTSNQGEFITNNIYYLNDNQEIWGTHGLLINNKNIDKIIEKTKWIDSQIDIKLADLGKSNELNILVIQPYIVSMISLISDINDLSIETFYTNYHTAY